MLSFERMDPRQKKYSELFKMKNYTDSYASRMERMDEYLDGTKGIDRTARLKTYDIDDLADYAGYLGADQGQIDRIYSVLIDIIEEVSG